MIPIEVAQRINSLIESCPRELAFGLEVKEELEDFLATQIRGVVIWIIGRKLLYPAQVRASGSITETFKMDKLGELLIPILAGDYGV